jgi:hypothetical protein
MMNRVTSAVKQAVTGLSRFNVILVIILIVQLILAVVVFLPTASAVNQSQGPLLKGFDPASVTGLTIHDQNNASQLTFSKDSSGNWTMPSADNYPISSSQVTSLLGKIKALDTNRLIAQNASSQNRLQVSSDTYQRLVEIKQGDKTDKLYVGSAQGAGNANMRLNDDTQIYLTSGLASTDISTTLSSWFDTPYFSVTQDDVVQIALANSHASYKFDKSNNVWTWGAIPKGQTLNATKITDILGQLASIQPTLPLGKTEQDKYGMKSPLATIVLTTQVSTTPTPAPTSPLKLPVGPTPTLGNQTVSATYTLTIGAKQADGNYVMKSSGSPYFVEISSALAETIINLQNSDLITPPATQAATQPAAPGATPTALPVVTAAATDSATSAATEVATLGQ